MHSLATLPPRALLHKWAFYDGPHPYAYLAEYLNGQGYRVITRKDPEGRFVTGHDVRRFIHRAIQHHPAYPVGRPLTADDYDRIKVAIITENDEEALA